jgi:hypothetical protein
MDIYKRLMGLNTHNMEIVLNGFYRKRYPNFKGKLEAVKSQDKFVLKDASNGCVVLLVSIVSDMRGLWYLSYTGRNGELHETSLEKEMKWEAYLRNFIRRVKLNGVYEI